MEDPEESLESVGGVGKLPMSARCPNESPRCGRFVGSSGLDSVKTSSSCGDRARDGKVVDADLPECAGAVLETKECRRIGFRGIGDS